MFKNFFFSAAFLAAFGAQDLQAANTIGAAQNAKIEAFASLPITLRAGTSITLSLNQEVAPGDVSVGNAIEFMVRNDVTVNGKVLIAAGAPAIGIVQKIAAGSMTIAVESVQAVDGQTVNLNSIPHIVKLPTASIGTMLSARVRNDVRING